MDSWGILGLDGPTSDLKAIKRAYAKKLRITRPDDDPDGFMALRDAYDDARFSLTYNAEASRAPDMSSEITPVSKPENQGLPSKYMTRAKHLLDHKRKRYKRDLWDSLMDDVDMLDINGFLDFEDMFRAHLLEFFGYFENGITKNNRVQDPAPVNSEIGLLFSRRMGWYSRFNRPAHIQKQIKWLQIELWITPTALSYQRLNASQNKTISFGSQMFAALALVIFSALAAKSLQFILPKFGYHL